MSKLIIALLAVGGFILGNAYQIYSVAQAVIHLLIMLVALTTLKESP